MNGLAKALLTLAAITAIACHTSRSQEFSASPEYANFFATRYDSNRRNEPTVAIWWLIEKFSDTAWSRQRLHDELVRYTNCFPESTEHVKRAKLHIETLERMLGEQRPSNDQRIEQLIYDLRDVNVEQCSQPAPKVSVVGRTYIMHSESKMRERTQNHDIQRTTRSERFDNGQVSQL